MVKRASCLLAMGMVLVAVLPAHADSVSGAVQNGYGRLAFTTPAKISASATGGVLTISFSAKTDIDPAAVVAAMPRAIASGKADADGKTLRFVLNQPVKLHVSQQGNRAVVDMAEPGFAGTMPDLPVPVKTAPKPVDPNTLPVLKLRAGSYANFTRLVFDWPKDVSYRVFPGAGKMTIRFDAPVRADLSVIARMPPPWVKNAAWRIEGNSTIVEFETDSDSGYHDFKDGTHVVLDVLAPKTDAAAYAPPGTAKPSVTRMDSKGGGMVSTAQAQAIAQTAVALATKTKPAAPPPKAEAKADIKADAKVDAKADAKPTDTKPADAAPVTAARTPSGALIRLRGAAQAPSAVFVRGLTAWIVLENTPGFEAKTIKAALGDFAAGTEALSNGGLNILRVTLKAPAAIAAHAQDDMLVVEIAKDAAPPPLAIGLARNQNDPRRASLSTLLPGADHAFAVSDPASGDKLILVPGTVGRGLPGQRFFADFTALTSASGLVVAPYADDLSVTVAQNRVVIDRPGGLSLTPPQMPVAQSPAALAGLGDGPTFLNFAQWGSAHDGSFLATQRRLTHDIAKADSALAGPARIALAHFYLANGFGAEALGLIKLTQGSDPALAGDPQMATMRAAADIMLARYRDAHNELASPAFDSDRHAALWRGLAEAGLEDWKDAHAHLEQASPVLDRYPPLWRATALLADANAGLGLNRLDLADAALSRLPKDLTKDQAQEAELIRGRMLGAASYLAAAEHYKNVIAGGNERLAAQAIYYQINAALAAHAMTDAQAIEQLERLRFRWRGDGLELKTLRQLASLYFARGQWRDGLKTLHIATANFGGSDAARMAQDDMRAAFVNLYMKGGADKMKPVDALALFYDNMDLTPIGPDGDEMIRRMADRLVAVDLLGPAANLLAYQVDKRLDGIAKAQVATRLAAIYLMDHKADKAVAAIRDTSITGLPDTEMHARMLLEARAFAALKQWDNALDLIAVDQAEDTRRLRADIYWESGNWAVAGQKAEELVTDAQPQAPLSDQDRAELLRATVAYSLANDSASLERLRTRFGARMRGTPDANIFAVLSAPLDQHGLAFRDAAAKIAAVDTLQAFMKDFARRKDAKS